MILPDEVQRIAGIDVSKWQCMQRKIDWRKVRAAGYRFAFIRASCGEEIDPHFLTNWREAREAGVIVGAYHYFEPWVNELLQADVFAGALHAAGDLQQQWLPPCLDAEELTMRAEPLLAWLKTVEDALGRCPWIYASPGIWTPAVGNDARFARHPLWLADWTPPDDPPQPWGDWIVWQTGKGSVDGIDVPTDLDVLNGDESVLELLSAIS